MNSDLTSKKRTVPRLRLRVTAAAETIVRGGHPWLFAQSIREQNRDGVTGELAVVFDRNDKFLAVGLFDAESPIRVRILRAGKQQPIDDAWWRARLERAIAARRGLFDERTNGFRLINGESDDWPGLVLDRYGDTLVLKLYSAAWLARWTEAQRWLEEAFPTERLVLRLSRNIQALALKQHHLADGQIIRGAPVTEPVVFRENDLHFEADVLRGQKTGFFLDQRENRARVESLAQGRAVLNAFSFSGGFSLYAARGGAASVTNLDLSAHALASAERNFQLNQSVPAISRCPRRGIQAEAFEWLGGQSQPDFDLIVLDPPSLAKRESERAGAIRAYARLVQLALARLRREGILVACSCSAHVDSASFFETIRSAATGSRRVIEILQTTGHAADHPATFKEAEYLKAMFLRCS